MTKTCPVPTPTERQFAAIHERTVQRLRDTIDAALREAAEQARCEMQAAGLDRQPPSHDYFAANAHQHLYCRLCKADPQTFSGGRADIALAVIRNSQRIAKHHWGADIEPYP